MDFQFSGPVPQNDIMERRKETKNEGGLLQKRKRRKDMKMRKKIIAGLLTATMVLGMSMTSFAEPTYTVGNNQGTETDKPDAADRATVKITGITGTPTVTLYKIASVKYGPGEVEFVDYEWASGVDFVDPEKPTANEINNIAQRLTGAATPEITPKSVDKTEKVGDTYSKEVEAGVYIAVITGATDGKIYNPILLTATYSDDGKLYAGEVGSGENYLWGSTAVAKSSTPGVDKEITDGVTVDATNGTINTASVGDVVDYKVTPTVPTYPSNAKNKTFFISDRLSAGLTFEYDSLTVTVNDTALTRSEDGNTFTYADGTVVANAVAKDNGFNLNFVYDELVYDAEGHVYAPVITYSGVINDNAVVGDDGNNNKVIYYYGDPNTGTTWKDVNDEPDEAPGVNKKEDEETVYTYQLAFLKTGEDTDNDGNPNPLAGAKFGIYKDADCTQLIDVVTTNENGYAVSTNVESGIYYVKELVAPTGYSLNDKVYAITADWETATTTSTVTETERTYTTSNPSGDALQVGWIKNNVFYTWDEVDPETAENDGYQAAYLESEKTTTASESTFVKNEDVVGGTALMEDAIPNTKLSTLPGTGGIGTTIFTIGGCAIMIAAAGLYFASRRKENK